MISFVVPAGSSMPTMTSASWSEAPSSAMVGTSGSSAPRLALITASARRVPALT